MPHQEVCDDGQGHTDVLQQVQALPEQEDGAHQDDDRPGGVHRPHQGQRQVFHGVISGDPGGKDQETLGEDPFLDRPAPESALEEEGREDERRQDGIQEQDRNDGVVPEGKLFGRIIAAQKGRRQEGKEPPHGLQDGLQLPDHIGSGGPARREADDGMVRIAGLPDVESDLLLQLRHPAVLQDDELLVGRGLEEEGDAFAPQDSNEVLRPLDGVRRDPAIEIVREERVELNAEQPAFCQEGAVLFHRREEVFRGSLRENDGFPAEGSDLGSADIEDIAEVFQVREGIVAGRTGQGIAQTGPVDEERQLVLMRNRLDFSEF